MIVPSVCRFVHPEEGVRFPWNWRYRPFSAAMWVLGIEPRSSARAVDALNR